jgi:hypothetical protein
MAGLDVNDIFGVSGTQAIPIEQWTEAQWANARANPQRSGYERFKQYDPQVIAANKTASTTATQGEIATAQASNPPPPAYSGPTAQAELQALLPTGFESTLIPSSAADPYISSTMAKGRGTAQDFIQNLFKRGTTSGSGRESALTALGTQDPGVKSRLTDISNALLEGERSKLRGIAGQGYSAAGGQSGEFFDPSPWKSQADTEAAQFLQAFPASYTTAVGDTGGLYDTSGLTGAAGAAKGPRNVSFDPYAVEGGKLSTGLEEGAAPPPSKKRSTAVF